MAKDTYYLKHDSNSAHDPKIEAMIQRFGMVGYGRFWRMAEILREQSDYHLPRRKWGLTALAKAWECPEGEAEEFVEALISDFELFKSDGETVWSDRIMRDMAVLNNRREEAKRSAEASWASRRNAKPPQNNADAKRPQCETTATAMLLEQSSTAQLLEEASSSRETAQSATPPAAAAFSLPALKKRLADASILTTPAELESIAAELVARSADCETFIAWALAKAAKARQPSSWFARGLLEWDWIGKWRAEGGGPPKAETPYVLELHHSTPEDDAEVERLAAETRERLHMVDPPKEGEAAAATGPSDFADIPF